MTSLVQSGSANNLAGATATISVTLPAPPTPGNLLVAVLGAGAANPTATPWGVAVDASSIITASIRQFVYSKVAGASEPATVSATLASQNTHRLTVYEFAPTAGKSWTGLDAQAVAQDAGVTVTALTSGTTPPTTAVDGVAVAAFTMNSTVAGFALTNGYAPVTNGNGGSGHLVLTAPGAQETTASWTTARRVAGAIAAYKQAVGAPNTGTGFLALI